MAKNWKTNLSPKKYVQRKARTLKLGKCYINSNWKEGGMAHVVVTRRHTDGVIEIVRNQSLYLHNKQ
jgi:hypothetical protein